jgi:hypothetical protein
VVVSSDNVAISRIQKVTLGNCDCLQEERPGRQREEFPANLGAEMVKLYPNPVIQDYVLVEGIQTTDLEIPWKISDAQGKLCLEGKSAFIKNAPLSIPVLALENGLYFLSISMADGQTESFKFIITKNQ